jgi:cytoskeletal protein CcmA (bactofilin family)
MFNRKKNKASSVRIDTLIGENTRISGNIDFTGGLKIDGHVAGNLSAAPDSKSVLTLSEHGSIEGEVRVPHLVINGPITGHVYALEHVELAPKAKIKGNVYYRMLEMEMGAEVNGQLIHITDDNAAILDLSHESNDAQDSLHLEQQNNLD